MAITKTTQFKKIEIKENGEMIVFMSYTLDDPNDDELPITQEKQVCLTGSDDITSLPSAVQTIINSARGVL